MMCSHPFADELFKPRLPAFTEAQRGGGKATFHGTSCDHILLGALILQASKALVPSVFSSYLLSYSISVPFTDLSASFPCKSGCSQRLTPGPALSFLFSHSPGNHRRGITSPFTTGHSHTLLPRLLSPTRALVSLASLKHSFASALFQLNTPPPTPQDCAPS